MMENISQRRPSPMNFPSHGLWSLWDMITLDGRRFVTILHTLIDLEFKIRGKTGSIGNVETADVGTRALIADLDALELPVSKKTAEEMMLGCPTVEKLHKGIEQLFTNISLEIDGRKFYGPIGKYQQYYEQPELFGKEVFDNFAPANNDIFEAGTCLALERGTACVMHLMRVLEVGLKTLAANIGVAEQNDWGAYVREIEKELAERTKILGKRTPDDPFFAEASVTLNSVRLAWRNPTMHVENNYSPERAEEILIAVRSLMRHLATKLIAW